MNIKIGDTIKFKSVLGEDFAEVIKVNKCTVTAVKEFKTLCILKSKILEVIPCED